MVVTLNDGRLVDIQFTYQPKQRHKTTCQITIISGEVIVNSSEGISKLQNWDVQPDFYAGRRIALNKALQKIWPAIGICKAHSGGWLNPPEDITFLCPKNRQPRKELWSAMIAQGFRVVRESPVAKLKRQLQMEIDSRGLRARVAAKQERERIESVNVMPPAPTTDEFNDDQRPF